ncbi:hypothetical protein WH47_08259 [Habropoda laboriosa]|uniref:Uncharacterized protein n=1 Tax=Habropoda laboriosa TaxID=597456 RepID=A0A0L7RGP4_9HYME|nr:hypothetical protein WH47_08259 [Habropoda laboriosa]
MLVAFSTNDSGNSRVAFGLTKGKDVRSRNNGRSRICDEVVEVTVVRSCDFFYWGTALTRGVDGIETF